MLSSDHSSRGSPETSPATLCALTARYGDNSCHAALSTAPSLTCRVLLLQQITMQVSSDETTLAVLHMMDSNGSQEDLRYKAMLQCNPFHSYMFNSNGRLLCASASAMDGMCCRVQGTLMFLADGPAAFSVIITAASKVSNHACRSVHVSCKSVSAVHCRSS